MYFIVVVRIPVALRLLMFYIYILCNGFFVVDHLFTINMNVSFADEEATQKPKQHDDDYDDSASTKGK